MLPVKRNLFPTVSRFFDDDWKNLFEWSNSDLASRNLSMPAVNIHEREDEFCVEMAAPGLLKENFKVSLDKNYLTISYQEESDSEEGNENGQYLKKEYNYASFSRSFHLNKDVVDDNNIDAKYENGILKISIPKREEAKSHPPKTIEIS
ncbi:Hsp20/alpha crystallin family protein [Portibacter lacus]|uniref:Heat-shock protein n=1 Tax=Portibacter lacus TaxID=1099794 RepID=A0AA37SL99_9BACT|nr:Hsp20 family protein [Portibacter lacus]GLR16045.1 heat-shock protein [Portibacter lacus]